MKLNPKLTGGLAWAGLIVILAVPSADMLTKGQGDAARTMTSDMDGIRTASVSSPSGATKPAVAGDDPVDTYVSKGKELPSYISDAPTSVAATKPATTVKLTVPGSTSGTDIASVATVVAPIPNPAPAWRTTTAAAPVQPVALDPMTTATTPVTTTTTPVTTAAIAPVPTTSADAPLILDEDVIARREAAVARVLDEDIAPQASPRIIDGDELEEWDSGSLADYLERKGMLSEDDVAARAEAPDDEGFFLDEMDEDRSERRLIRRLPRRDFFFF